MRRSAAERLTAITAVDRDYWARGIVIGGIDEAGRGPLAGPVSAACAVMPASPLIEGIDDSKKLSETARERLYDRIKETALFARVAFASAEEIERLNILEATKLAMARAAEGAPCGLFLVDAVQGVSLAGEQIALIRGDARSYSIAAASILAKVVRDRLMRELDARYPAYGFAEHKGYGTAKHIAAIRAHGLCPEHRTLFVRNFL